MRRLLFLISAFFAFGHANSQPGDIIGKELILDCSSFAESVEEFESLYSIELVKDGVHNLEYLKEHSSNRTNGLSFTIGFHESELDEEYLETLYRISIIEKDSQKKMEVYLYGFQELLFTEFPGTCIVTLDEFQEGKFLVHFTSDFITNDSNIPSRFLLKVRRIHNENEGYRRNDRFLEVSNLTEKVISDSLINYVNRKVRFME